MKWRPYSSYRSSELPSIARLPRHWHCSKVKHVASLNADVLQEETDPDYLLQYLDISSVDSAGSILGTEQLRFQAAPTRARRRVCHGDTVISTVRTYLRAIAFMDNPPENLIASTGFTVLRPASTMLPKYLWRAVQSQPFVAAVVAHSEGVGYPAIAPTRLAALQVPVPPLPEQRAIAAFLDRETARIDALIARQQRLIELLQEKRAALIAHAVTKGLDPSVPMKDTGVEWLKLVPKHWSPVALKRLARIRYGLGQPPPEADHGTPFIRATNVDRGRIRREDMLFVDPAEVPLSRDAVLNAGEILVVRSGAYTGDSAIVPPQYAGAIAGYDMVASVANGFAPFFAWQLLSPPVLVLQFGFYKLRAAQPHLNAEELGMTIVLSPPAPEQRAIAAFLDSETTKLDATVARVRQLIDRLTEYRFALITTAVTGQIDVREESNAHTD